MTTKTSVALDIDVVTRVDSVLNTDESRDTFFYKAIIQLIEQREQELHQKPYKNLRDTCDLERINQQSNYLNQEAQDDFRLISSLSGNT